MTEEITKCDYCNKEADEKNPQEWFYLRVPFNIFPKMFCRYRCLMEFLGELRKIK